MRIQWLIAICILAIIGVIWMALRQWPVINVVETGRTPEYPDIVARAYEARTDEVVDAVLHAVNRMPRWSLLGHQEDTGEIRVEARTRVLRFVDDVAIRVREAGPTTVVGVRSASRVGRGDFGQNARNIRAFFQELDRQMTERPKQHDARTRS